MSITLRARSGVIWSTLGTVLNGLVNLVFIAILARTLNPQDFGAVEILLAFVVISEVLVESGLGQAIIRMDKNDERALNTIFWINLGLSIVVYTVLYSMSEGISRFFEIPILNELSKLLFVVIVFNSISIVQQALYAKELNFKTPSLINFIALILAGVVSVYLAFKGYGVWALASHLVLNALLKSCLYFIVCKWKPGFQFSVSSISPHFHFGKYLIIQAVLDRVITNAESLVIGKNFNTYDLGLFSQGRKLNTYILQTIGSVVKKVSYPAMSHLQSDPIRLKAAFRRVIGTSMVLMTPVCAIVVITAHELVVTLFGDKWVGSVVYLKVFIVMGLFVNLQSYFINVFLVKGNTKKLLVISLIKQAFKVFVIILLLNISILALVIGIATVGVGASLVYAYYGGREINYSLWELCSDVSNVLVITVLSALLASYLAPMVVSQVILLLLVKALILSISFIALMYISGDKYFFEALRLLRLTDK